MSLPPKNMVLPLKNLVKIKTSDKVCVCVCVCVFVCVCVCALRALVWANNKGEGGPGPPGPSPGSATVLIITSLKSYMQQVAIILLYPALGKLVSIRSLRP